MGGGTTWTRKGNEAAQQAHTRLTPAEAETARLVRQGLTRKAVAKRLGISIFTVNKRMEAVREKQSCTR